MRGGSRRVAGLLLLALLSLSAASQAETIQQGQLRVKFRGRLTPSSLPHATRSPVELSFGVRIASTGSKAPPRLKRLSIAVNRYGRIDHTGLPVCDLDEIQPATNAEALTLCEDSLVGEGSFSAKVSYEGQKPFPTHGKLYAFNGRANGRPAILAHVYGTLPGPTSYTLPFIIRRSKGTFGTTLNMAVPEATAHGGYITGITLKLSRTFTYRGRTHSYLSGSCPTPVGVRKASFPLVRGSFYFAGGKTLRQTLTRSCRVQP